MTEFYMQSRTTRKQKLDSMGKLLLLKTLETIRSKNDDATFFVTGLTGSGKSSLVMHLYQLCTENSEEHKVMTTDVIGFTIPQYAAALKYNKDNFSKGHRFSWNDEANVTKHSVLSKENKDLLDLKFAIRGLGFLDFWCNPSADILQKELIKEVIKGLFFVYTKNTDGNPRKYMYFSKQALLNLFEKHGNLENKTLLKHGPRFASFIGWFDRFKGPFWDEYAEKKDSRMEDKVEAFADKYFDAQGTLLSRGDVAKQLGVHPDTVNEYFKEAEERNLVEEGVHYVKKGVWNKFLEPIIEIFNDIMIDRQKKRFGRNIS